MVAMVHAIGTRLTFFPVIYIHGNSISWGRADLFQRLCFLFSTPVALRSPFSSPIRKWVFLQGPEIHVPPGAFFPRGGSVVCMVRRIFLGIPPKVATRKTEEVTI